MFTAQFLALVLTNTNMLMGGQGYCAFDFTLRDKVADYSDVAIVLRPQFDPNNTATGNTALDDITLAANNVGRKSLKITTDTDCNVTGFSVIKATAMKDGAPVDLINTQALSIGKKNQLPITIDGN
jgi:hypothetical protein